MSNYRIKKIGFSYFVQQYSLINYDGILDYDWKNIARFDDSDSAIIHMNWNIEMDEKRRTKQCL